MSGHIPVPSMLPQGGIKYLDGLKRGVIPSSWFVARRQSWVESGFCSGREGGRNLSDTRACVLWKSDSITTSGSISRGEMRHYGSSRHPLPASYWPWGFWRSWRSPVEAQGISEDPKLRGSVDKGPALSRQVVFNQVLEWKTKALVRKIGSGPRCDCNV